MSIIKKIKLPDNTVVDINDIRLHVYRNLTGTAAIDTDPYSCTKYNVADSTVSAYEDGMIVCMKIPEEGNKTYGTAFQINSLGYKPLVYNVNTPIGTRYSVGSVIWAVYNNTQTADIYLDSSDAVTVTGCWQIMDYNNDLSTSVMLRVWTNI